MGSKKGGQKKKQRKKQKKKRGVISSIILIIALAVFCVSGYQLFKYGKGYVAGRSEYSHIRDIATKAGDKEDEFRVNFQKLFDVNTDTVAWIRFYPEPSTINYPVVQGQDNQEYLNKSFSGSVNASGTIFLAAENRGNFLDRNSIIYGHRMDDRSMFWHLEDYSDPEFYKKYPCFYIYTPDRCKRTYRIFSTCVVEDVSETYTTSFFSDEQYQNFIDMTKETAEYDTGVEVGLSDLIVTLSTCTSANDNHRYVVRGVLESNEKLEEE